MSQEISRLFDFAHYQLQNYNLPKAFNTKYNGKWVATSTQEFIDKGNAISRGLLKLGIKPGDKIAVISTNNRTEWNILDLGILQIGAISIPIYPTISKEDLIEEKINLVVQINGKKRAILKVKRDMIEREILEIIKLNQEVKKFINNQKIKKSIFVPNRLINIIL